jgi:Polysaccharide pyruvyl transferase
MNTILILGYYDKNNLGDEAYRLVFPKLFPADELIFANPRVYPIKNQMSLDKIDYIICGGGDIIENWFHNAFTVLFKKIRCPIYAVSIGITFESTISQKYLGHFNRVYVRHRGYASELSDVLGSENVFHIPDITFLLEPVLPRQMLSTKPVIGVFMATGMEKVVLQLKATLDSLSDRFRIIMYAFNTSELEHEGDIFFARKFGYEIDERKLSVSEMMGEMSTLHLAICVRYHSHIFSIIQNVPFVSLAMTPKVRMLMEDHGYISNVAQSVEQIDQCIKYALDSRTEIMEKNEEIAQRCREILSNLQICVDTNTNNDPVKIADRAVTMLKSGHSAEAVVGTVLKSITGTIKSKYTYGFVENVKENTHSMHSMVHWVYHDYKSSSSTSGIVLFQPAEEFMNIHRSGWYYVVTMLNALYNRKGILCDVYVDGTFLWNEETYLAQGVLPFKKPWIGFIHHTPMGGDNNLYKLFAKKSFQLSLQHCKGLITLSEHTRQWVQANAGGIRVFKLKHPTETVDKSNWFDVDNYVSQPRFVQIGAWLRDSYAIYRLKAAWAQKCVLVGPNMDGYRHPANLRLRDGSKCTLGVCNVHLKSKHVYPSDTCACLIGQTGQPGVMCRPSTNLNICVQHILYWLWHRANYGEIPASITVIENGTGCNCGQSSDDSMVAVNEILEKNYESVAAISTLNNEEYDLLLSKTVVFLHLEDASAVNTVIECIMRNTPIIVNKLPAVVEYLGDEYPLYYNASDLSEIERFTLADIRRAHEYLYKMNKKEYYIDTFLEGIRKILKEI